MSAIYETSIAEEQLRRFGFGDYLDTASLRRLRGISYLSTMDRIYDQRQTYSRYEHSVGVGYVALLLARQLHLSDDQLRTLVLINLTHDTGHVAFSHAAETFLLERFRRYHDGLKRRLFVGLGIPERLSKESECVATSVNDYVSTRKTSDTLLNMICGCSLNCDRVEGTNRSLFALNEEHIDPEILISALEVEENRLLLKRELLPLVQQFWRRQEFLYEKYIYTYEVLAAEAMLTRALELAFRQFTDDDAKTVFLTLSDQEATEHMKADKIAGDLVDALRDRRYFSSLASQFPELVEQYEPQARRVRFDPVGRKQIEMAISRRIDCRPELVITHFSYRKHFRTDDVSLAQLSLFEGEGFVSAERFNRSIYKTNKSGEVFDIFVPRSC